MSQTKHILCAPNIRYRTRTAYAASKRSTHLQAEEVGDGADIVREHEFSKAHDPSLVASVVEVELPQQLSDLEGVLKRCQKKEEKNETSTQKTHKNDFVFSVYDHWQSIPRVKVMELSSSKIGRG